MLVCPEKWNHPEYDGLFINCDHQGMHLVAWNASKAQKHKGSVSKLVTMLEQFSQREENTINFVSVRFIFIVPTNDLHGFKLPNNSEDLFAKQQLTSYGFSGFDVLGTSPSE